MAHKVFICHSSRDKLVADAACAALEAHRIPCWIAPRDILAGEEYGAALIDALDECQIVLLIFSLSANNSPQVRREIERAVSKEKIIVPYRIEDVLPSRAMEFALMNTHWLDALTPPIEQHLTDLCNTIARIIQKHSPLSEPLWATNTREARTRAQYEAEQKARDEELARQRQIVEQKTREEAARNAAEARAAWKREAEDQRRQYEEARKALEADEIRQQQAVKRRAQEQADHKATEEGVARPKADEFKKQEEETRRQQEKTQKAAEIRNPARTDSKPHKPEHAQNGIVSGQKHDTKPNNVNEWFERPTLSAFVSVYFLTALLVSVVGFPVWYFLGKDKDYTLFIYKALATALGMRMVSFANVVRRRWLQYAMMTIGIFMSLLVVGWWLT